MIARTAPLLTLEQLADVGGIGLATLQVWMESDFFQLADLAAKGSGRPFSIGDAIVLKLAVSVFDEMRFGGMPISAEGALVHAYSAKGWKPGYTLIVAVAPIAKEFGMAKFAWFHEESDSYGGLMRGKEITHGLADITSFEGLATVALTRLQNEVLRQIGTGVLRLVRC